MFKPTNHRNDSQKWAKTQVGSVLQTKLKDKSKQKGTYGCCGRHGDFIQLLTLNLQAFFKSCYIGLFFNFTCKRKLRECETLSHGKSLVLQLRGEGEEPPLSVKQLLLCSAVLSYCVKLRTKLKTSALAPTRKRLCGKTPARKNDCSKSALIQSACCCQGTVSRVRHCSLSLSSTEQKQSLYVIETDT